MKMMESKVMMSFDDMIQDALNAKRLLRSQGILGSLGGGVAVKDVVN